MSRRSSRVEVSVVIVSWKTPELLRACLSTLDTECRHLGKPTEIIVIDNGSRDGSVEMVRSEFPESVVIENRRNVGFAAANNQGLRECTGRYVLLLNPDTELKAGALKRMIDFMDAHPAVGAVGPRLVNPDGSLQESCYPAPTLFRELWRLLHFDLLHPIALYPMEKWSLDQPRKVETIQGACLLLRHETVAQVGILDEKFFVYTEEIDYCRRIALAGWKLLWVPTAVVIHHGGQATRQVAGKMFIQLYRSKLLYFRKHYGVLVGGLYKLILLAGILPRVVLAPLAMAFAARAREKFRSVLRLYTLLLLELKTL
jgi:GT2 family glycosyltransferase